MGMGYAGNVADVIDSNDLNNITKGLVNELEALFEGKDFSMDDFAQDVEFDYDNIDDEDLWNKAEKLYHGIQAVFRGKTGLEVNLRFHSQDDNGDRYDGVNGLYWDVDGFYEISPAGKRLKEIANVERQFFVTFG
jgi:hypothetical protein